MAAETKLAFSSARSPPLILISAPRSQTRTTLHPESKDSSQQERGEDRAGGGWGRRDDEDGLERKKRKKSGRRPKCNLPPPAPPPPPYNHLTSSFLDGSSGPPPTHTLLTLLHCGTTPHRTRKNPGSERTKTQKSCDRSAFCSSRTRTFSFNDLFRGNIPTTPSKRSTNILRPSWNRTSVKRAGTPRARVQGRTVCCASGCHG